MHAMERLAEAARGLRGFPRNPLKSLSGGGFAGVRKQPPLSLISRAFFAAAGVPPYTPLRACARVGAARMRIEVFAR
jgi:hypothetical protein